MCTTFWKSSDLASAERTEKLAVEFTSDLAETLGSSTVGWTANRTLLGIRKVGQRVGRYGGKPAVVASNTLDWQFEVTAPDKV